MSGLPEGKRTILFLHRGGAQIRGTEDALLTILRALDRSRFEAIVWCTNPAMRDAVASVGIESHVHDFAELGFYPRHPSLPLRRFSRTLRWLTRFCRERRVSLLFCNGGSPCQLAVPVGRWLGLPTICLFHHPASRPHHRNWLTRFVGKFVFISEFTAQHTLEQIGREGELIPMGIDVNRFSPASVREPEWRQSLGFSPDDVVFAQVGALVPHKEHRTLIEAFARVQASQPGTRLLIIGAGPEREALERLVGERGLGEQVVFTGYVDDPLPYLQHVVDVNVLASREEGLGIVNLQASACGLPNVGADSTGIRETIIRDGTGLLVPVSDPVALATAMIRLARDAELRSAMGRAGRRMAETKFSKEPYCARIEAVLHEAIRSGAQPARALHPTAL